MRKSLIIVLLLSLLFGTLFALGGAGIYGSPFASVPANSPSRHEHDVERLLVALTILVGPLACGAALTVHRKYPPLGMHTLGPWSDCRCVPRDDHEICLSSCHQGCVHQRNTA